MLRHLSIQHVALISQLDIEFYDGFSVLTGETGAGKSIIIEAFNFVLGERASRDLIQTGAHKASVEATFALSEKDPVWVVLRELELEPDEQELILYRELTDSGKNSCRINGTLVSTAILKQVGDVLVDIHGQHAHQGLLNPKLHVDMLDNFAGEKVQELKKKVAKAYQTASTAGKQLHAAESNARDRERRCDLLAYQIQEIDDAKLVDGEEEELEEQRKLLQNSQAIMEALEKSAEMLTGDEQVLPQLSEVMHAMDGIASYQQSYSDTADRIREAYYNLEDIGYTIRDLRSSFAYDPEKLDQIEWRLELITGLERKYGANIAEILEYRTQIGEEYDLLATSEERREELRKTYETALREYREYTVSLTKLRKAAATSLSKQLLPQLRDLGMAGASFEVAFETLEGELPSANGADEIEFLLSANRGEPLKPLSKVASGGELSRIMLAFKSVLAETDGIPTMVFDEIDTGISGQIGTAVAIKMRQIAQQHQVLSITHLAQIASYASHHYLVYKQAEGEKTSSHAVLLSEEERVAEIARIMGSKPGDAVAMQHAKQLILAANEEHIKE